MSTRGNSNARGRATTRAIESAAVRLAVDHGAAALTVAQICAEAGVAPRTFFHHFETKEDAILGREMPRVDEQRTREYLSSPSVGVLSGALSLVVLPAAEGDDAQVLLARLSVLRTSPALAERQALRLRPLADEVRGIVRLKLAGLDPRRADTDLDVAAALITQMASSLMLTSALPSVDGAPAPSIHDLAWVWDRLL